MAYKIIGSLTRVAYIITLLARLWHSLSVIFIVINDINQLSPGTNFMIEISKIMFHHDKKPHELVKLLSFVRLVTFSSLLLLVDEDSFFVSLLIGS